MSFKILFWNVEKPSPRKGKYRNLKMGSELGRLATLHNPDLVILAEVNNAQVTATGFRTFGMSPVCFGEFSPQLAGFSSWNSTPVYRPPGYCASAIYDHSISTNLSFTFRDGVSFASTVPASVRGGFEGHIVLDLKKGGDLYQIIAVHAQTKQPHNNTHLLAMFQFLRASSFAGQQIVIGDFNRTIDKMRASGNLGKNTDVTTAQFILRRLDSIVEPIDETRTPLGLSAPTSLTKPRKRIDLGFAVKGAKSELMHLTSVQMGKAAGGPDHYPILVSVG